jgi:serine protease Do
MSTIPYDPARRMQAAAVALPLRALRAYMAQLFALLVILALAVPALAQTQVAQIPLPQETQDRPISFADLAEAVSPAVVNITTSTRVPAQLDRGGPQLPEGSPFQEFFEEFFNRDPQQRPRPRQSQSLGSGFVISDDGYIVTNNHVIEGADEIRVEFFSGHTLTAELVGTDPATDIALLKVEPENPLPHVAWGNSETARVGEWVIAVGNPLGQGFSVSAGIISAKGRALQGNFDDFIQTDAAINRGNSGGPLFNMQGEVIGVNTAILSPTGGSIGIGFAMSSAVATQVVDQLREFGATRRGWLGVRIQDVTDDVAEALGLERARGALVTEVMEGPARDAEMQAGDVILRFDGGDVADTRELVRRVADAGVGRAVEVVVHRDGEEQTIEVVLGLREDGTRVAAEPSADVDEPSEYLGMELAPLTPELRLELNIASDAQGLVVRQVEPGSDAEAKGLMAGDLITEAGQQPLSTLAEFQERVQEARDAGRRTILLMVRRGDEPRFVALSVEE